MDWNTTKTYDHLTRESRRIRHHSEHLTTSEADVFSSVLYEVAWALANTQPWPHGHGEHLSEECIATLQRAADLIMSERRQTANENGSIFMGLTPITGGQVVAFPERDRPK